MTHGAYLNEAKRGARATRDKHRRRGEREALSILKASGLQGDPLARLVARQVGRLEAMVHRLEHHHELRGYFNQANELKPSVAREADTIAKLLDEARRLFEQLREFSPARKVKPDVEQVHRVEYVGVDEASEPQGTPSWTDPATLAAAFAASRISGPPLPGVELDGSESVKEAGEKKPEKKPPPEAPSPPSSEPPTRPETAAEKYGWIHCFGGDEN
ncbi:MAG: hypothetical protein L0170_07320 [Acidobacteria bacterium]|nr:hypothetical protein [Acidobacteriota bacterium]